MLFQQDGALRHTTRANMALLQETFPGLVISCRGDINMQFDTIRLFCAAARKSVIMHSWALKNQHSSIYGLDTAQYVSTSDRKLKSKELMLTTQYVVVI